MGLFSKLFGKSSKDKLKYNCKASSYKMDTLEDIESIPVPTKKFEYSCDFTESIEYVLQRKATQYKKEGKMDLAIACLRKSNDIMPFAPMTYTPKDYERLEKYLKLAGKFDEAKRAQLNISNTIATQESDIKNKCLQMSMLSDMIEVLRETRVCSECAKYHGRIYAKSGKKGFPDMRLFMDYYNTKKCGCNLSFYPYWYDDSSILCIKNDLLNYSNRPFEDDRTNEEKKKYNDYIEKIKSDTKDRNDYDWLCENLPDKAPKSYGGYRNMKNKNSENYQKLVLIAKENGYII